MRTRSVRLTVTLALGASAALAAASVRPASATITSTPISSERDYANADEQLVVAGTNAKLYWQDNGDLELYSIENGVALTKLWEAGTSGSDREIRLENNGDLVIRSFEGTVYWSRTSSYTGTDAFLAIDDDCDLMAKRPNCTVLWTVEGACPGEATARATDGWCVDKTARQVILENDKAELAWGTDGNLGLYANGADDGEWIWSAWTSSPTGNKLCFEQGGRLVAYNASGVAAWSTGTTGNSAHEHVLELDDCAVTVTDWNTGSTIYTNGAVCPQPSEYAQFTRTVDTAADTVILSNDDAELVLTTSGELRLRSLDGDLYWKSGTTGTYLTFQGDGNLVLKNASGSWVWGTQTGTTSATLLYLERCQFQMKNASGTVVFQRGPSDCDQELLSVSSSSVTKSYTNKGNLRVLQSDDAYLEWQSDGNLCLYTASGSSLWCAGVHGTTLQLGGTDAIRVLSSSGSTIYTSNETDNSNAIWLYDCTLEVGFKVGDWFFTNKTLHEGCKVGGYSYSRGDGDDSLGYDLSSTMTATSGADPKVESYTVLQVSLFGNRIELFEGYGYQSKNDLGNDEENGTLDILGDSFDLNFSVEKTFVKKEKTYMVGVVPVACEIGLTGSLGLSVSYTYPELTVTPQAGLYVSASAGVGGTGKFANASAGLKGDLTVIQLSLPIAMKVYSQNSQWKYDVDIDLVLETLSGAVALYAKAGLEAWGVEWSVEWSYKLWSWTGLSWTWDLYDDTGTF